MNNHTFVINCSRTSGSLWNSTLASSCNTGICFSFSKCTLKRERRAVLHCAWTASGPQTTHCLLSSVHSRATNSCQERPFKRWLSDRNLSRASRDTVWTTAGVTHFTFISTNSSHQALGAHQACVDNSPGWEFNYQPLTDKIHQPLNNKSLFCVWNPATFIFHQYLAGGWCSL